jgi:hypothetical protein
MDGPSGYVGAEPPPPSPPRGAVRVRHISVEWYGVQYLTPYNNQAYSLNNEP